MDDLSCMDILYTTLFDLLNDSDLTDIVDIDADFKKRAYYIALRDGTEVEIFLRPLRRKGSCAIIPLDPHNRVKDKGDSV
ncbi:hypothetical protein KQI82_02135 [Oscillibacter sp. MSJ-2]|uniref:Uncharacterized protein n=1 Tax=Dysosmobacter acutus TaxID=2841504 RepID=A0ABS6F811_9FIRM|nr:hypothetical protein [Dysosmobacter acutus]MBU5625732.1 hypothetical protein [Dysosmobacter acutus]